MLKPLVKEMQAILIQKVIVDGAFVDGADYSRKNFKFLSNAEIEPIIKGKANSSPKAKGCIPRKMMAVIEQLQDITKWKKKKRG